MAPCTTKAKIMDSTAATTAGSASPSSGPAGTASWTRCGGRVAIRVRPKKMSGFLNKVAKLRLNTEPTPNWAVIVESCMRYPPRAV